MGVAVLKPNPGGSRTLGEPERGGVDSGGRGLRPILLVRLARRGKARGVLVIFSFSLFFHKSSFWGFSAAAGDFERTVGKVKLIIRHPLEHSVPGLYGRPPTAA